MTLTTLEWTLSRSSVERFPCASFNLLNLLHLFRCKILVYNKTLSAFCSVLALTCSKMASKWLFFNILRDFCLFFVIFRQILPENFWTRIFRVARPYINSRWNSNKALDFCSLCAVLCDLRRHWCHASRSKIILDKSCQKINGIYFILFEEPNHYSSQYLTTLVKIMTL